jgi:ABC-type uncharacterized transport system involved in gliding motility auxiliary subunit
MNGKVKGVVALALVAAVIVSVNLILSSLSLRIDMTEEKLYSLSEGSRTVLSKLDSDVSLKFYFSESAEDMPMGVKTYAEQVKYLLKEFERAANGRIVLESFDPKPDSDAEEWARRYGVEPQRVNPLGSPVYFGVVAVCGDNEQTLPVVSPVTENRLEYDLVRLVTRVAWPERPVIGLMTSLPGVLGEPMNQMMMQGMRPRQAWVVFSELQNDYEIREIPTSAEKIDDDVKALVVLHAKDLSEKTLFAIDQFVLRGGRLVACVDPLSIIDMMSSQQRQNPMMMQQGGGAGPSTLGKLFEAWGVGFDAGKLACDIAAATTMQTGADLPAILSLGKENMNADDFTVSGLTQVMLPFAGAFTWKETSGIEFKPLIVTSADKACLVEAEIAQYDMDGIMRKMEPDGVRRTLAARLSGGFKTAFPKGPDWKDGSTNAVPEVIQSGNGSVALFADSDFIADQFCVRPLNTMFGKVVQPINENITLFFNIIEQYAGREELIGLRSRGKSDRPFEKVDKLEADANDRGRKELERLEQKLEASRKRLMALESEKSGNERMLLSPAQQEEILKCRKEEQDVARQLKNVRKELKSEIESLGTTLKTINILVVPLLIVIIGVVRGVIRRRRCRRG